MTSTSCDSVLLYVWHGLEQSLSDDANWRMANALACYVFVPVADILNIFCDYHLFSLYLMNFMFHTMLDAAGNILRVPYKSMKCNVSFSLGNVSTLFRWGGHFAKYCKTFLPAYNSAKIIKTIEIFQNYDHKCIATFLWFTVCAFGQTYQQWPNANTFGEMRMHLVNCSAHLAKYIHN